MELSSDYVEPGMLSTSSEAGRPYLEILSGLRKYTKDATETVTKKLLKPRE